MQIAEQQFTNIFSVIVSFCGMAKWCLPLAGVSVCVCQADASSGTKELTLITL